MTTTYHNTPIKSCDNCAYQRGSGESAMCAKTGFHCVLQRQMPDWGCDADWSGWVQRPPKPPHRSLRRWLYDLLLS